MKTIQSFFFFSTCGAFQAAIFLAILTSGGTAVRDDAGVEHSLVATSCTAGPEEPPFCPPYQPGRPSLPAPVRPHWQDITDGRA